MKFVKNKLGFTLVEVVATVTVIAILAVTTLVIYTNWRKQVLTAQIKSDLTSAATAMEDAKNFGSGYPSSIPSNFTPSEGVKLAISSTSSSDKYCIDGSSADHALDSSYYYHIKQNQTSATSGSCSGDNWVVPGVPTNIVATTQSNSAIQITWSAVSGATRYSVQRSTDSGFTNSVVTTAVSSPSFISSSLLANTTYYYRVLASNDAGSSNFSSTVNATTSQGSCSGGYGTYPSCYAYDSTPVGTSISGYFTSAPSGYLLEDGSAVSRTTYAALFAVIGTTYGAGDGSTTFNLPNSRGRVSVNLSASDAEFNTIGKKYGEKTHTLSLSEMPSHNHGIYIGTVDDQNWSGSDFSDYPQYPPSDGPGQYADGQSTGSTGGGSAHNIIQPSITKLSVIKYTSPPTSSDTVAVGTSIDGYWSSSIPDGYLVEDGSAISRSTYSDLFDLIGTTYGAGDGSTTFNLPDSRGRVGVNLDSYDAKFNTIGEKYGEKKHKVTISEMAKHVHPTYVTYVDDQNWTGYAHTDSIQYPPSDGPGQYNNGQVSLSSGGDQAYNIIQPSIVNRSLIKVKKTVDPSAINKSPVGTSISGYFTSAPSGYLLEDGSAVSRTTYAALFAVIGTTYGAGDGSTTFNLPDSRGRVSVNLSASDAEFNRVGETYGEERHQLTVAELPNHSHGLYTGTVDDLNWNGYSFSTYPQYPPGDAGGQYNHGQTTMPAGGDKSHNIIQPSIVKLYAIKY